VVGSVPTYFTTANRDVVVVLRADDAVVVPVVRRHLQDRPLGELERHVAWQLDPGRVDIVGQLSDEVAPGRHDDLVEAVVDRPSDGLVHPLPGQDGIAAVVVDLPLIQIDGVLVDVHRRQRRCRPVAQRPSTLAVAWNRFHLARVALRGIGRRRPVEPRDRGASDGASPPDRPSSPSQPAASKTVNPKTAPADHAAHPFVIQLLCIVQD